MWNKGKKFFLSTILMTLTWNLSGQGFTQERHGPGGMEYIVDSIVTIDRYDGNDGYYIFQPKEDPSSAVDSGAIVVFVHGYGAINPRIFGSWIAHLVKRGNIVIYPKYQKNIFQPASSRFTPNTATAVVDALNLLEANGTYIAHREMIYMGHSFGGVIVANLMSDFSDYGLPKPSAALVVEAGTGPFTAAIKDDYSQIPTDLPLITIIGSRDLTVGSSFGKYLAKQTRHLDHSLCLTQEPAAHKEWVITASHYEPYAVSNWCDNGYENLTSKRADYVGKEDAVDYHGYWKWLDILIDCSGMDDCSWWFENDNEVLSLGAWPDGVPIISLQKEEFFKEN